LKKHDIPSPPTYTENISWRVFLEGEWRNKFYAIRFWKKG